MAPEVTIEATEACARRLDEADPVAAMRSRFHLMPGVYFCGNSLGLKPKSARELVDQELDDWA